MKKKLFINDDFTNSQYLWILPIIDGFCEKNKIRDIIFLKKLPNNIENSKVIKNFFQKYSIEIIEKKNKSKLLKLINVIFIFTKNIKLIKKIFINSPLKNSKDWYELQIDHAVWDYANILLKESKLKKNFYIRFLSFIVSLTKIELGKLLIKKNVTHAFIGHSVYASRALMAQLREHNIKFTIKQILQFINSLKL